MSSIEQDVKKTLVDMALPVENIDNAICEIIEMRERLADSMNKFENKGLMRFLAISQDTKAIQSIERITDGIIQQQGVLELAMQGKDIHDELANIKAKIYSLITGDNEEPQTLSKLKSTTQRMTKLNRREFPPEGN